jgi:hypothetical protein
MKAIRAFVWVFFLTLLLTPLLALGSGNLRISGAVVDIEADSIVVESQNERFRFSIPAELRKETLEIGARVTVTVPIKDGTVIEGLEVWPSPPQAPGQAPKPGPSSRPILNDRMAFPA